MDLLRHFASFSDLTALPPLFTPLSISFVKKTTMIAVPPKPIAARYVA
jgi:hypothetical protein